MRRVISIAMRGWAIPAALGFLIGPAAAPKLAGVFGDHMVLQRGMPVPVPGPAPIRGAAPGFQRPGRRT